MKNDQMEPDEVSFYACGVDQSKRRASKLKNGKGTKIVSRRKAVKCKSRKKKKRREGYIYKQAK